MFARLTDEKAEVNQAMEQLSAINDEKMHWRLAQQAARDELHKRLAGERQQLAEIQAKINQKRAEISANQSNFEKQLQTKTDQYDAERTQRLRMEEQMAGAREQLKSLQIAFDQTPDEIREEIEQVRKEKLKHQGLMTAIRAKYQSIQKGYENGEGIRDYLERARYSLLHPDLHEECILPQ
ncbi:hypothetical protein BVRB_024320 [Beta vulgaris subsp. vulgaris]|uniref:Uncharacterized protein n=1 Tax=Beta vulgaris subsp. vulgaris TaxID=3555 RepID=A0A0J8B2R2_BETVV|nr:hypothetical protein BVRB_024320 [Beta vulgaris subsp. vulgaris]